MKYTTATMDKLLQQEEVRRKQITREIGVRIRAAREEAHMSQLQVAVAIGLSDKTISSYEAARISPPIDKLIQLAELFKKPVAFFLGYDPKEYKVGSRLRAIEIALKDIKKQLDEIKLLSQTLDLDI
jgi:transcriptional regulator with XRE-family HTH domain